MDEISSLHCLLTKVLLIGSFIVFAAGATGPALGGFWGMSLEDGAHWIAAHPGTWALSGILFIVSLFMCVSGLAIFNEALQTVDAQLLARIGLVIYLIGSLFWIIDIGFRLSVELWAARIFAETSSFPESFTPLRILQSRLSDIFMISTFIASAIYGLSLLKSSQFPISVGWFSVVYGLFMAAAYALTGGPIPIMVLVVPLILGLISPCPSLGM